MADHFDSFTEDGAIVVDALAAYLADSRAKRGPVIGQPPIDELIGTLDLAGHVERGDLRGEGLKRFLQRYLAATTRLHHPGFLAHQVAASHPTGALGSLVDGATNNAMAIYEMGPAASAIEYFVLNWMIERIGWPTVPGRDQLDPASGHAGGVLTHGGSLANLTALLTARSARVPSFWDEGNPGGLVVLVPEQSHYSMQRAVAMLGIGARNCLALPADAEGRARPGAARRLVESLERSGRRVIALVGNACGTAAGLYDPLAELAAVCRDHGIWFHVDAAHGGGALLSPKLRHSVAGIELADSVIWDAHKMMCTPTVCAAVLVRDHRHLDAAFQLDASYLVHDKHQPGIDFLPRAVECTKAGLGLRLFMTLAAMGERGMRAHVERLTGLARDAAGLIAARADLELAVHPETNILCFRAGKDDRVQLEIRRRLLERGRFYVSTTLYRGVRWLRLVFMNPATTLDDVRELLDEVRGIAGGVAAGG